MMTVTGSNSVSLNIGLDGESILSSNDPWYRLFAAWTDLVLAGDISLGLFQEQVEEWNVEWRDRQPFRRTFACPAAKRLLALMTLACDEPDHTDDERRLRLRELMGRG